MVVMLRDPVARAFSNHLHEVRKGHITSTILFEEAEPLNPMYLEQGCYAAHLARWFHVFGREPILVLLAEEVAKDPEAALDATYAHIGVAVGVRPPRFAERRHESVDARSRTLQSILRAGGDGLRAVGLGETLEKAKRLSPMRALLTLNHQDLRHVVPEMLPETRARLEAHFAQDVLRLAEMLGRDSLPWPTWRATAKA